MTSAYMVVAVAAALAMGCSSTSTTTGGPPPGTETGGDAGGSTPSKAAPASASEAPALEGFDTSIQDTVPAGNTPIPQGVHCDPISDTATDIAYACNVLASKTQKIDTLGYTCSAVSPTLFAGGQQALTAVAAPKVGTDFGFSIPKASFPTMSEVQLDADCKGGGVEASRLYALEPVEK